MHKYHIKLLGNLNGVTFPAPLPPATWWLVTATIFIFFVQFYYLSSPFSPNLYKKNSDPNFVELVVD